MVSDLLNESDVPTLSPSTAAVNVWAALVHFASGQQQQATGEQMGMVCAIGRAFSRRSRARPCVRAQAAGRAAAVTGGGMGVATAAAALAHTDSSRTPAASSLGRSRRETNAKPRRNELCGRRAH